MFVAAVNVSTIVYGYAAIRPELVARLVDATGICEEYRGQATKPLRLAHNCRNCGAPVSALELACSYCKSE